MPTPELFRVFPWVRGARRSERGHALYATPLQGAGRIDNPESYRALYASDTRAGAVAEAFGNHAVWTPLLLSGRPDLEGSARAIATLWASSLEVVDLDDPRALVARGLRPSRVVTRDRSVTQQWAMRIYEERAWSGVRWWSYYDSSWGSYGVWDLSGLRVTGIEILTRDHPALEEAAAVLMRPWETKR